MKQVEAKINNNYKKNIEGCFNQKVFKIRMIDCSKKYTLIDLHISESYLELNIGDCVEIDNYEFKVVEKFYHYYTLRAEETRVKKLIFDTISIPWDTKIAVDVSSDEILDKIDNVVEETLDEIDSGTQNVEKFVESYVRNEIFAY